MKRYVFGLCVVAMLASALVADTGLLRAYRLPYPALDAEVTYLDLDNDGDPDVLRTTTQDGTPVQWIDDDDDMKEGDLAGDLDSDCLMIDVNRDGKYGHFHDFIVDRGDEDGDGKADIEVVVDNAAPKDTGWGPGHYMIVVDVDGDGIFNYVDWKDFKLKCWEHSGLSHFFEDYLGNSLFLKMHTSTYNIRNLEYNWENPFLFYDYDKDGVAEVAIRFCDSPAIHDAEKDFVLPENSAALTKEKRRVEFLRKIDWASLAFDVDNDSTPGNEFDFDMTINFEGGGFDYSDQIHQWQSLSGLRETDSFFYDARWRKLTRLIYPDHDAAWDLVFQRGKWEQVRFVYDEDDDCHRWERVELYKAFDPFKIGTNKGGVDNHGQSDEMGDRGEWDKDNSGNGRLYVSRFDGRVHLYGAEWGCWRIDQDAKYFQAWSRTNRKPKQFPTVKYSDTDENGFFDRIEYDLDGDKAFERVVNLKELEIDDTCEVIETASMNYKTICRLHKKIAEQLWANAQQAVKVAQAYGVDVAPYALINDPHSLREKYHYGYWLQFYLHNDLMYLAQRRGDAELSRQIDIAYFGGNWNALKK